MEFAGTIHTPPLGSRDLLPSRPIIRLENESATLDPQGKEGLFRLVVDKDFSCFPRLGALEINPLVAHLTIQFGRFRGVLISKLAAVAIAMGVRRLLWAVNVFYAAIVIWNLATIAGLFWHAK